MGKPDFITESVAARSGTVVCPASSCSPRWPRARMVFVRSDPNRNHGLDGPPTHPGFSDPVLSTVCPYPFLRPAHISRQLLCFRFSPFAARSGGSARPVELPFRGQRPDDARRPVGHRLRDHDLRLACQHPGQPGVRYLTTPACVVYNRHGSRDQESSLVSLTHLRYSAQPRPAAGRVLPGHEAEPSREVAPTPAALHRWRKGLDGQGGDRSDSRDPSAAPSLLQFSRARARSLLSSPSIFSSRPSIRSSSRLPRSTTASGRAESPSSSTPTSCVILALPCGATTPNSAR